jgi:hypothetical protein
MLGEERKEVHTERNLHKVACDIFEAKVRGLLFDALREGFEFHPELERPEKCG